MTLSSWDETKKRSQYHFDNTRIDPEFDTVIRIGHIRPNWETDLDKIIATSKSVTWRTRGQVGKNRPEEELAKEDYDLERLGYGKDFEVSNLNWNIPESLQKIADMFGLGDQMTRIHVQMPGQMWNLHLDKLEKWSPNNLNSIVRYMVHLTPYEPGHFWSYGNYVHTGWQAGDITSFDWQNVPHSTANAGHNPRVTLQLTGIITDKTRHFLEQLKR